MAEQIDLTSPDQANPGTLDYKVVTLGLGYEAPEVGSYIVIGLLGSTGIKKTFKYSGATAHQLLVALNTANLNTKSLQRRILEKLIADGLLSGTISGTLY